jgi:O-antigen ligase
MFVHRALGFAPLLAKPAPVILDPLAAIGYVALLIGVTVMTMRRPSYGICALVVSQPFAFYQLESAWLARVVLIAVLLGLLAYRDAFAPIGERGPWRIVVAAIIVLGTIVISFAQAAYPDMTMRETLKMLEYIVIFCAVVAAFRLDDDRRSVRSALLGTTILVAALALVQEVTGSPSAMLLNGHPIPRIAGPLEGPNQLAGYFDVMLPVAFAFAIEELSPLAIAALFTIVATDVLTFSRGGIIGAVAGTLAIAFAARRNLRVPFAAIGGGLATGLGVAVSWGIFAHAFGLERFWDFSQSDYAGGVGTRPELWRAAWTLWQRHPLLGIGAGNFELEIPLTGLHGVRTHANSLYLQSLVEDGIPGFVATLWLVYTSIVTFAREQLRSPFVLAAFGASIALGLHQVIDLLTFYPKVATAWWIVMGLGAAELSVPVRVSQAACAQ